MTDPGLPLTTGEGNTAGRETEIGRTLRHAQATRSTRSDSWLNGYQEDVAWLLAECSRLREQLDAARQALQELLDWSDRMPDAGFTSESPRWQWWHERPAAAARAALGVEGPAE